MEDLDGQGTTLDDLDPGIRKTVEWLLDLGYATCDSGDGHSKLAQGYAEEEIIPVPHVIMQTSGSLMMTTTYRLVDDLAAIGVKVEPISPYGSGVSIQATYDPADDSATIALYGLNDEMLEKCRGDV